MIYLEEDKRVKSWKKCNKKKEKDGSCKMSYLSGCLQDWKITSQTSVFRFLGLFSPIYQSTNKNSLYTGIYIFLKNHFYSPPPLLENHFFSQKFYMLLWFCSLHWGKFIIFFQGKLTILWVKSIKKHGEKNLPFDVPFFPPNSSKIISTPTPTPLGGCNWEKHTPDNHRVPIPIDIAIN